FDVSNFVVRSSQNVDSKGLKGSFYFDFMTPVGVKLFKFKESLIFTSKVRNIETFEARSEDSSVELRLSLFENSLSGIMHTAEGYFFIENVDFKTSTFSLKAMSEYDLTNFKCGVDDILESIDKDGKKGKIASVSPFPVGTTLRKYRLAAAATGEFVTNYGSQSTALARIVDVINAANLIYELEASVRFELITATTNFTILFSNSGTDPYTDVSGASAANSQTAFNTMNTNGTLLYNSYDIGHTFHIFPSSGISAAGQAGSNPCSNSNKSRAWTMWSSGTTFPGNLGFITGIFVHEVGHQFTAPHSYNAVGGPDSTNITFCAAGWSSTSAVEPGSGSTIMAYKNNCLVPSNYTLSGNNSTGYFHTKSLDFILGYVVSTSGTCFTSTSTGNSPPVANAGVDISIPRGTPFMLTGIATDAQNNSMSFAWDQVDVASTNDRGAFGSNVTGTGGYTAVNSTATAPLFRSELTRASPTRYFPRLDYVLANNNIAPDSRGEVLPQVARSMKFRFTVRDNVANGGGVDSDDINVTVTSAGPLEVTSYGSTATLSPGTSYTLAWNVNSTNTLAANVKISLSVDGGLSFPYELATSTPNDGSQSVLLPVNLPSSTKARLKIAGVINAFAEFFDINNADLTISGSCLAAVNYVCNEAPTSGNPGSSNLNLGLSNFYATKVANASKVFSQTSSNRTIVNYTDANFNTCIARTSTSAQPSYLVNFRVTSAGRYQITAYKNSTGFLPFTVFNSNTLNCSTFLGANSYGTYAGMFSATLDLNPCTLYTMVLYGISSSDNATLTISGPGDWLESTNTPSGFSFTNLAVNPNNNKVIAVSASSSFDILQTGNYVIYGFSYPSSIKPNSFVDQPLSSLLNSGCSSLSSNNKPVSVLGTPCSSALTLASTAPSAVVSSASTISSTQIVNNGEYLFYKANNSILLTPLSASGFVVQAGAVFKAEISPCN
ncbi:MAG: reprolysin-like metallopeptidase, partial [Leadbetterella sp.]